MPPTSVKKALERMRTKLVVRRDKLDQEIAMCDAVLRAAPRRGQRRKKGKTRG